MIDKIDNRTYTEDLTDPATEALREARAIFERLEAAPTLAEVDQLLQDADSLTA